MTDNAKEDIQRYKELLADAQAEIAKLRERVGHCSTTILNTVLAQEQQEAEVLFLRERVRELETIVEESEQVRAASEQVFAAMQGAMGRMQETIRKVTEQARETMSKAEIREQIAELEAAAADSTLNEDELADYNSRIQALRDKVTGG